MTRSLYRLVPLTAAIVVVCTTAACSSSRSLVAKATAYDTYYQARYMWVCIEKAGPTTCAPCQTAINDAAKIIPVANAAQKISNLPKAAVKELHDLISRLEACP